MTMQQIGTDVIIDGGITLPLSRGIITNGFLFLSGQLALGPDGKLVGGDIAAQTHQTLDNIEGGLMLAGLTLADVCKATIWLSEAGDYAGFNAAYGERMSKPYPARSTVVSGLLIPGARLEIEVVAALRDQR